MMPVVEIPDVANIEGIMDPEPQLGSITIEGIRRTTRPRKPLRRFTFSEFD